MRDGREYSETGEGGAFGSTDASMNLTSTASARKACLRKACQQARNAVSVESRHAADVAIACRLTALPEWKAARVVFSYLSFGSEVDTHGIIECAWRQGKIVALPRCVSGTRQMHWFETTSFQGLERTPRGFCEPPDSPALFVDPARIGRAAIALVPALVFDKQCFRIGYGGGFYDVFLTAFPGIAAGLAREAQVVETLADLGVIEPHDKPTSLVVTEERIIRPSSW